MGQQVRNGGVTIPPYSYCGARTIEGPVTQNNSATAALRRDEVFISDFSALNWDAALLGAALLREIDCTRNEITQRGEAIGPDATITTYTHHQPPIDTTCVEREKRKKTNK